MEQEQLAGVLEALLFVSSKPLKIKDLAKTMELEESAILAALEALKQQKEGQGVVVLESNGEYQLSTNNKFSAQVKNFLNAELREKLSDATVEVLAIIAYRQPISKAEIEAIRGVNSQYSLRNLLMRGLIEKVANPDDARSVNYQTTGEFLMHLGLGSTNDLPEFEKLVEHIKLPQTPALAPSPGPSGSPPPQTNTEPSPADAQESRVRQVPVQAAAEVDYPIPVTIEQTTVDTENSSPVDEEEQFDEDEEGDEDEE